MVKVSSRLWKIVTPCGAAMLLAGCGGGTHRSSGITGPARQAAHRHVRAQHAPTPARLVDRSTGRLATPVQDAAAVSIGDRAMLLGGLTAADTSRADVVVAGPSSDREAGTLPTAVHDTAAVQIGDAVYVFGGGTNAGTQSAAIVRVPLGGGQGTVVGALPAPSSDQAAARIGSSAYIVGGFTGTRWLNTIVRWQPGTGARVVARLPYPLRYAAVASANGRLVIAGGSLESGSAGSSVLEYRPGHRGVRDLGHLPTPTTHAAAAARGAVVYVVGGRGAAPASLSRHIYFVDTVSGRIGSAGLLPAARSDLSAVTIGARVLLAGGRTVDGTDSALSELVAAPAGRRSRSTTRAATSVYAFDGSGELTGAARFAKPLVYVPNSGSDTVDVIDPGTFRVVRTFRVGLLPQHVVPAWDLRTLYVTNDVGNSLTPIDPRTGRVEGRVISVEDPYNMYFTPDGRYAIVVAERLGRLDFRDAHTFKLHRSVHVPCVGVDHMDFSADGRYLVASCEFSGQLVEVDVAAERVVRTITLPDGYGAMPQDVKLSSDGQTFYVADMHAGGVWALAASTLHVRRFIATGAGAHGLYPSRDGRELYVSNRSAGTVSVLSMRSGRKLATWRIPGGGSPDMGGVSANGKVLWLSGRYNADVYAISTKDGRLLARIPVGAGPHGLCVWPQPGRYSLGHTGILR